MDRIASGDAGRSYRCVKTFLTEERTIMSKVAAYHTNSPEYPPTHREVYHDHDDCGYGKEIKPQHKISGTGGKHRCKECQRLG